MGKGKGHANATAKISNNPATLEGCNCPTGCLKKEPIDIDHPPPENAILLVCSADEKCPINKYVHTECFEQFENEMIRHMQGAPGHSRSLTKEQCRRGMWQRKSYDLIFKHCKCACGGHLKRSSDQDVGSAVEPTRTQCVDGTATVTKNKKKKVKKELPTLTVGHSNLVGSSSYPRPAPAVNLLLKDGEICAKFEHPLPAYIPGLAVIEPESPKLLQKSEKFKISAKNDRTTSATKIATKIESKTHAFDSAVQGPIREHCVVEFHENLLKFIAVEKHFKVWAEWLENL